MNSRFSQSQTTLAVVAAAAAGRHDTRVDATGEIPEMTRVPVCRQVRRNGVGARRDATRRDAACLTCYARSSVYVVGAFDAAARGARVCVIQQRGEKWRCAERNEFFSLLDSVYVVVESFLPLSRTSPFERSAVWNPSDRGRRKSFRPFKLYRDCISQLFCLNFLSQNGNLSRIRIII